MFVLWLTSTHARTAIPDLLRAQFLLYVSVTAMDTAKKKKGPPKFNQHLPKERGSSRESRSTDQRVTKNSHGRNNPAKKLKSAWIQTRKIKSKWNAERRRQVNHTKSSSTVPEPGTTVSDVSGILTEQKLDHQPHLIGPDTGSGEPSSEFEERPAKVSNPQVAREPVCTAKTGPTGRSSQQKDRRSGRSSGHQGKRPSMRNRMNALLEKIQREIN